MSSMYDASTEVQFAAEFVMSYRLTVQNMHRRALLFIDNRQFFGFLHKQN